MKSNAKLKTSFGLAVIAVAIGGGCATGGSSSQKTELNDHDRAMLLVDIANGALVEGDSTGALAKLVEAERIDSSVPELHHSKALAFFAKRDYASAVDSARRAVSLNPEYADAQNTLGKLLLDTGRLAEAEVYLRKSAEDKLYRGSFKSRANLGILYYRRGEYDRSEKELSKAIDEAPSVACISHYYRGHIFLRRKEVKKALQDYRESVKNVCGGFADAHYALAEALARDGQVDEARKKYVEVTRIFQGTDVAERAVKRLQELP